MSENDYVANGNMYGCSRTYSNPFTDTKPFKASINRLYSFMLQRCLDVTREFDDVGISLEFDLLRLIKKEIHADNPLSIILNNDTYYFSDTKVIWRIDKYETLSNT